MRVLELRPIRLLVLALAFCSACAGTQTATDDTAATPSVSASATTAETPSPTEPAADETASPSPEQPDALGPDSVASVVTTDLVVRSRPEISDESEILSPSLSSPTLLYVVDGPVTASGYDWYQVHPFGMHYLDFMTGAPPFGWVAAASREGEPWIAAATPECPSTDVDTVRVDTIRAMTNIALLACFGGTEDLTLEGEFGGCFVADPAAIEPGWLYQTGCSLVPPGYQLGQVLPDPGGLPMRFAADVPIPFDLEGELVRVAGRFDDPIARTCEPVAIDGEEFGGVTQSIEPAQAVLLCRAQFVVTQVDLLD